MVKGSPRHSQSNGGVERVNLTVQKKLAIWMKQNNSTNWAFGSMITQWQINTSYHHGIKNVPYKLAYGQNPRVGISQLPIDKQVLSALATEAEISELIGLCQAVPPAASSTTTDTINGDDHVAVSDAGLNCAIAAVDAEEIAAGEEVVAAVMDSVKDAGNLSPTDPMHPEYGLKPAAITNIADSNGADTAETGVVFANTDDTNKGTCTECFVNTVFHLKSHKTSVIITTTASTSNVAEAFAQIEIKNSGFCAAVEESGSWVGVVRNRNSNEVTNDELSRAVLLATFPCIWCIDDKDFENPLKWKRAFLRKVTADEWEVLDEWKDELLDIIHWDGDEGLNTMWGFYAKTPTPADVDAARREAKANDTKKQEEDAALDLSPKRKAERANATENQRKQAKKMATRAKKADGGGDIKAGDVVLIPVSDADRGKLDTGNIKAVVVEVANNDYYRVACKQGLLQTLYAYHRLTRVTGPSNDRILHDLDDVYSSWRGLSKVAERTVVKLLSVTKGNQVIKCGCKKKCNTMSCSCKAAGQFCTSRCHRGNTCCINFDNSSLL